MKNFRLKLRSLSLTQQLLLIVVLTLSSFLFFLFGTVTSNINAVVDMQIYDLIQHKQNDVIFNYISGVPEEVLFGYPDDKIIHIINTREGEYVSNDISQIEPALLAQIKIQLDGDDLDEPIQYRFLDSRLYTIRNIPEKNATIATIISQDYNHSYKRVLLNNIVNIMAMILAVIFTILLIWVSSIIHPLNVIKNYITKIRKGEKATLIINREDEIGQLASVIVEMNEEIRHQEKVKEEMIQNISHDLKTPIATIKSYSEAIKDGVYPYETLEKSVDVILEHADRLEKKVFSLMTLNRLDYLASEGKVQYHEFELRDIIEQVIVSSMQIGKGVDIRLEGDNSLVYGMEEPWRIVIENLVDNALRYAKTEIVIKVEDHHVSVYNDGSSIDTNRVEQLFRAYEKGDGGQFGLGLSIVNKALTEFGYNINARNENEGVIFEIRRNKNDRKKR